MSNAPYIIDRDIVLRALHLMMDLIASGAAHPNGAGREAVDRIWGQTSVMPKDVLVGCLSRLAPMVPINMKLNDQELLEWERDVRLANVQAAIAHVKNGGKFPRTWMEIDQVDREKWMDARKQWGREVMQYAKNDAEQTIALHKELEDSGLA